MRIKSMDKRRRGPFQWYHIYYILAAFDLLTISSSLYLNYTLTEQYNESVNENRAWATRHKDFTQLARLAAELNAPGNDVFHSQNVDTETTRLTVRLKNFNRKLNEVEKEFSDHGVDLKYPRLKKDLDSAKAALSSMISVERKVLTLVADNRKEEASQQMALMDKEYLYATKSLLRARLQFSEIQQSLLDIQANEVAQMRVFECWLAVALVVMISGVTYNGKRLADQILLDSRQREFHIKELEATRCGLENKTQELETALLQLRKAQETISESERKFRAIFDHTFQFIGLMQPDGLVLEVNETALKFAGKSKDEVVGLYFWETPWWSHSLELQERLKQAIADASNGHFVRFEASHPSADGELVSVDFSLKPVFDHDGKIVLLIPEGRDISDKKRAELRVSEFYSTVSHELRTPLTAIRGSLGLIEGGLAGDVSEKTLKLVEIASNESDRLIRLINDILDLRKIEAGMLDLNRRAVTAEKLVNSTILSLTPLASQSEIALKCHLNYSGILHCDEDRTVQILNNLISNAIKFSENKAEVVICSEQTNEDMIRFSVKDSGPGIPAHLQEKLFGRFQQIDQSDKRKKGGTGLGLAISKALVEQHGGKIGLTSNNGPGCTFWFELPRTSPTT